MDRFVVEKSFAATPPSLNALRIAALAASFALKATAVLPPVVVTSRVRVRRFGARVTTPVPLTVSRSACEPQRAGSVVAPAAPFCPAAAVLIAAAAPAATTTASKTAPAINAFLPTFHLPMFTVPPLLRVHALGSSCAPDVSRPGNRHGQGPRHGTRARCRRPLRGDRVGRHLHHGRSGVEGDDLEALGTPGPARVGSHSCQLDHPSGADYGPRRTHHLRSPPATARDRRERDEQRLADPERLVSRTGTFGSTALDDDCRPVGGFGGGPCSGAVSFAAAIATPAGSRPSVRARQRSAQKLIEATIGLRHRPTPPTRPTARAAWSNR